MWFRQRTCVHRVLGQHLQQLVSRTHHGSGADHDAGCAAEALSRGSLRDGAHQIACVARVKSRKHNAMKNKRNNHNANNDATTQSIYPSPSARGVRRAPVRATRDLQVAPIHVQRRTKYIDND